MNLKTNTWKLTNRQHWTAVAVSYLSFSLAAHFELVILYLIQGHVMDYSYFNLYSGFFYVVASFLATVIVIPQSMLLQIVVQGAPMDMWSFAWRGAAVAAAVWAIMISLICAWRGAFPMPWIVGEILGCALAGAFSGWALCQYLFWLERRERLAAANDPKPIS